jgi:hypothetical protein
MKRSFSENLFCAPIDIAIVRRRLPIRLDNPFKVKNYETEQSQEPGQHSQLQFFCVAQHPVTQAAHWPPLMFLCSFLLRGFAPDKLEIFFSMIVDNFFNQKTDKKLLFCLL